MKESKAKKQLKQKGKENFIKIPLSLHTFPWVILTLLCHLLSSYISKDYLSLHQNRSPLMGSLSTFLCHSITSSWLVIITLSTLPFFKTISSQSHLCRTSCGDIPINYPFGIDEGCGNPYYKDILTCSSMEKLELHTLSGRYPVHSISYNDPHILIFDPFMWNCADNDNFRPTRPFTLSPNTHLSLSPRNNYLYFNCSSNDVIIEPKPSFCKQFQCDSSCDSTSYLCRNLPDCPSALNGRSSCCSYNPKAAVSTSLMMKHCSSYTSVYWKSINSGDDQVAEYGIRVDFDIPVITSCLACKNNSRGGGTCGFDTQSESFLCLCKERNVTTYCTDPGMPEHSGRIGVIAGATTVVSFGAIGVGAGLWYIRKVRTRAPVTYGVQNNENRLF